MVGPIVLICGLVVLGIWYWIRQKAKAITTWPSVRGRIVSSALERTKDLDNQWEEKAHVVYDYVVGGAALRASRIALGGSGRRGERAAVARYKAGSEVDVYYDPQKPSSAVLERQLAPTAWVLVVVGGLFAIVGAALTAAG